MEKTVQRRSGGTLASTIPPWPPIVANTGRAARNWPAASPRAPPIWARVTARGVTTKSAQWPMATARSAPIRSQSQPPNTTAPTPRPWLAVEMAFTRAGSPAPAGPWPRGGWLWNSTM